MTIEKISPLELRGQALTRKQAEENVSFEWELPGNRTVFIIHLNYKYPDWGLQISEDGRYGENFGFYEEVFPSFDEALSKVIDIWNNREEA